MLIFATFASSSPIRRQDALSGFKQCEGDFPNKITTYNYTPNPVVVGQVLTLHLGGQAVIPYQAGSVIQNTMFYQGKQVLQHNDDFCKVFVIPSGFTCPVKGNFDLYNQFPVDSNPDDPKNAVKDFFVRTIISNPDGKNLSCIEGNAKFYFP
ncbi:hypothetical protein RclHR1_00140046 [Rhizophagus clarus]|uniref:Uncharacterized protein n=1 Tax=Rhizophagus clarus TaxID=94130 RepID=A0A2Z6QFZ8_9GLOM|nr:hypothetical protein RclHR1_00140046 [Rhizophagus clarus]GES83537.1 hypothetical protein GLOIN_2v1689678 [Rhizophagus clarus]